MKIRNVLQIVVFCVVTATVFGQSTRLAGLWGTDGAANRRAMSVMLDLKVDARDNLSGSMTQYGVSLCGTPDAILRFNSVMVVGNTIKFVTTIPACAAAGTQAAQVTWTGILGNDDSLSIAGAAEARGGATGAGTAPGGDASRASGSRNPLGATPTNPLARGGDVPAPRGGAGGASGAVPALSFPSVIMHRM